MLLSSNNFKSEQISFLSIICFRLSLRMTFNLRVTWSFKQHHCFYRQ